MVGNSLSAAFELPHECMVHLPLSEAGLVPPCGSKKGTGNKLDGSCPSFSFCFPAAKPLLYSKDYRCWLSCYTKHLVHPAHQQIAFTLPVSRQSSSHPMCSGREAGTRDKAAFAYFPSLSKVLPLAILGTSATGWPCLEMPQPCWVLPWQMLPR